MAIKSFGQDWRIIAQSKSVSHMGRKNGPKTHFSARPWKDELGNGNVVHTKGMLILKMTGFERVEDLPRTTVGFSSKA